MSTMTVDIVSAHNIVMRFEAASTVTRIFAWFIDIVILIIYLVFCLNALKGYDVLIFIFVLPVFSFYHMFFEIYNHGQSIGKRMLKIRVVSLNGGTPNLPQYFIRWIFRTLDISFSVGMLAILFSASTQRKQRIGDVVAGTVVVKTQNENIVNLKTIEKPTPHIDILYPKITSFTDQDMLLVKDSLSRYVELPNPSNKNILLKLSENIQNRLDVRIPENETKLFLDKVLYEYIILTR